MRMKPVFVALAIASATLVTAGAAHAGIGIGVGPGGIYIDPGYDHDGRHYDNWGISRDQAIRIARDNGVRYVEDVDRTRRYFIVSGQTRRHNDIKVTIDRRDGDVVDIDR